MKKIIHFVHIHAAPAEVFAALTAAEGLARWWSTSVRVERAGAGGIVDFTFVEGFNPDMEVTAFEENRRVAWKCIAGHDNWQDNTFAFELDERDGETALMFTQVYAQELGDETYGTYNFNWGYYLGSLKKLCETGEGTPYQAG